MRGAIGSLNAAVAGSILLFEATTQRAGAEATGETPGVPAVAEAQPVAEAVAPAEPVLAGEAVPAALELSTATKRVRSSRSAKAAGSVANALPAGCGPASGEDDGQSEVKAARALKPAATSAARALKPRPSLPPSLLPSLPPRPAEVQAVTPPKSGAKAAAKSAKAPKPVASPPASADIGDDLLP